ncbi:MAG: beta-agarase [Acidobacteria bacterium]|nr:MAG: beta-agarase [Acidobacteriota bacterium]
MKKKLAPFTLLLACLFFVPGNLLSAGGYFRVEKRAGVWWFVTPSGKLTLSIGVNNISYRGDVIHGTTQHPYFENISRIFPSKDAWAQAELKRLSLWSFNTIGSWSDPALWNRTTPYTVILNIAARSGADWLKGIPVDVYSQRFETTARKIAKEECGPRAEDPELIGYFSDNELRWGPDWRGKQNMLAMYLDLPSSAMGRQHAIGFLRKRYSGQIDKLNNAWGVHANSFANVPSESGTEAFSTDNSEFLGIVARRYFEVCSHAIRAADPHHLYLGAKFAGTPPDPVLRASDRTDVVSVDIYRFDPRPIVEHIYKLAQRPVLVAEFAFRAEDSGLPNTRGAGPKVPNQAGRARAYADYVRWLENLPEAVGYHWFEWCDEPREGRFDGEDSNYGLVNIQDRSYMQFVTAVTQANREAVSIHQSLK